MQCSLCLPAYLHACSLGPYLGYKGLRRGHEILLRSPVACFLRETGKQEVWRHNGRLKPSTTPGMWRAGLLLICVCLAGLLGLTCRQLFTDSLSHWGFIYGWGKLDGRCNATQRVCPVDRDLLGACYVEVLDGSCTCSLRSLSFRAVRGVFFSVGPRPIDFEIHALQTWFCEVDISGGCPQPRRTIAACS